MPVACSYLIEDRAAPSYLEWVCCPHCVDRFGSKPGLVNMDLLPFVRQFRLADVADFDAMPNLQELQIWLRRFLESGALAKVMTLRQRWLSQRFFYHLALSDEWRQACADGEYRCSSRGQSLEQVGFIHASYAHQLAETHARFYDNVGAAILLTIDPAKLIAAGVIFKQEVTELGAEHFPHIYGALPLDAVVAAETWQPSQTKP